MGPQHLKRFFEETPPRLFDAWYREQLEKARKALSRAYQRSKGTNQALLDQDAPLEVFGETVARVGVQWKGYEWSGQGDFDLFFAVCMAKTVAYMHSRTRANRQRLVPMSTEDLLTAAAQHPVEPTQLSNTGRVLFQKTLATVMASSQLAPGGAVSEYIHNLETIVQDELSPAEICEKIGIKNTTLGSIRARARRAFGDPEKD